MVSTEQQLVRLFKTVGLVKIIGSGRKTYIKIIDRYGSLLEIVGGDEKVEVYLRKDYYDKIVKKETPEKQTP